MFLIARKFLQILNGRFFSPGQNVKLKKGRDRYKELLSVLLGQQYTCLPRIDLTSLTIFIYFLTIRKAKERLFEEGSDNECYTLKKKRGQRKEKK